MSILECAATTVGGSDDVGVAMPRQQAFLPCDCRDTDMLELVVGAGLRQLFCL
jgi:hypothetical protein